MKNVPHTVRDVFWPAWLDTLAGLESMFQGTVEASAEDYRKQGRFKYLEAAAKTGSQ